jgi:hypothetical protein
MELKYAERKGELFESLAKGDRGRAAELFGQHKENPKMMNDLRSSLKNRLLTGIGGSRFVETLLEVADEHGIDLLGEVIKPLKRQDLHNAVRSLADSGESGREIIGKVVEKKTSRALEPLMGDILAGLSIAQIEGDLPEIRRNTRILLDYQKDPYTHGTLTDVLGEFMKRGFVQPFREVFGQVKENDRIMEKLDLKVRNMVKKAWLKKNVPLLLNNINALSSVGFSGKNLQSILKYQFMALPKENQEKILSKIHNNLTKRGLASYFVSGMVLSPRGSIPEAQKQGLEDGDFVGTRRRYPLYFLNLGGNKVGFSICSIRPETPLTFIESGPDGTKSVKKISKMKDILAKYVHKVERGQMERGFIADSISLWDVTHRDILDSVKILHSVVSDLRERRKQG